MNYYKNCKVFFIFMLYFTYLEKAGSVFSGGVLLLRLILGVHENISISLVVVSSN